jgi:hypothetical protein
MNGLKFVCMRVKHLTFVDSVHFWPCLYASCPKPSALLQPHYFNTKANLDIVGPMPDKSYFGYNYIRFSEREAFLAWYEMRISSVPKQANVGTILPR